MQIKVTSIKKMISIGMLCLFLLPFSSFAIIKKGPLPADEAFKFSLVVKNAQELMATWEIAPGYYLYREHFNFTFKPAIPYEVEYPPTQLKHPQDEQKVEVYAETLHLPLLLKANNEHQQLALTVFYQGCSKNGFCYPPMHKTINVDLVKGSTTFGTKTSPELPAAHISAKAITSFILPIKMLLKNPQSVINLFYTQHIGFLYCIFILLGVFLAFTPCVLPMIPILTGIIVGQSKVTTRKAFSLSLTYVLGSALTYAAAGMLAAMMGSSLQVWLQQTWIIVLSSILFFALAFSLFGYYELRLPRRLHHHLLHLSNKQQGGTYVGVFVMAILSTLIVSPCVTAPLVGILLFIAQTGDIWLGGSALFAIGIGMGLPLMLVGISAGKWLPKRGPWMEAVKKLFGIAMLGMALWLLSRILSPFLAMLAWVTLVLILAFFLGIHLPKLVGQHKFHRILGVMVGIFGSLFVLGAAGVENPIHWINPTIQSNKSQIKPFIVVHNIEDLKKELEVAKKDNKPVILDFYADWCDSCVAMDRNVFSKSSVQEKLASYTLLRADLSANTAMDETLLRQYDVIAPPTILFFDPQGKEINTQRIVGEVDAKEFIDHMTTLWNKIALQN